jgi:hypothetical protein
VTTTTDQVNRPATCFADPFALLSSASLSWRQKKQALEHWEFDELQKMRATGENMPSAKPERSHLRAVRYCLRKIASGELRD